MQPAPLPALRSFPRFALFLSLSICHTRCKGEFTEYAVRRYRFKWVRVKRCQHAEYLAAAKPYKNDEKNRVKKRALIVAKGMQREWAWGWDKVECTALHVAHLSPLSLSFAQRWKIISVHFFAVACAMRLLWCFFAIPISYASLLSLVILWLISLALSLYLRREILLFRIA